MGGGPSQTVLPLHRRKVAQSGCVGGVGEEGAGSTLSNWPEHAESRGGADRRPR